MAQLSLFPVPDPIVDYFEDDGYCQTCGGEGFILTCCDDLCHGHGYCMHGDGERMCPACEGASL